MKRKLNLVVDLKVKQYNPLILKQMDTTELEFKILDDGLDVILTDLSADIIFTKPNKTIVIQNASIEENIVKSILLQDCLRMSGKANIEVELKKDTEIVSSFYIPVQIEGTSKENIHSDNTPNYIEALEEANVKSKEATDAANEAAINANNATRLAEDAKNLADEATNKAIIATENAEEAIQNVDLIISNAEETTSKATEAAEAANMVANSTNQSRQQIEEKWKEIQEKYEEQATSDIAMEVINARSSTENNKEFNNIDERFEEIEKAINTIHEENSLLDVEKINNQQNYSTEEQVIGTWINGKPLYRKVVTNINVEASKTAGTYAYQYVKVGDDLEELFVKEVYFISNTNTSKYMLPIIYDTGNILKVSVPNSDANYIMFSNNSTASGTATAIIEYTKTTD